MSHSYSSNRIHVIFSTKERKKSLSDDFQPKLWAYMAGIAHNQGFDIDDRWRRRRPCACSPRPAADYVSSQSRSALERKFL